MELCIPPLPPWQEGTRGVIQAFASLRLSPAARPGAAAGVGLPCGISDLHKSLARMINVKICCRLSLT